MTIEAHDPMKLTGQFDRGQVVELQDFNYTRLWVRIPKLTTVNTMTR